MLKKNTKKSKENKRIKAYKERYNILKKINKDFSKLDKEINKNLK